MLGHVFDPSYLGGRGLQFEVCLGKGSMRSENELKAKGLGALLQS